MFLHTYQSWITLREYQGLLTHAGIAHGFVTRSMGTGWHLVILVEPIPAQWVGGCCKYFPYQ